MADISDRNYIVFLSKGMLMLTRPENEQAHYGFPTKLGEYLLSSRPVIVSDVGDVRNYLSNGKMHLLCRQRVIWNLSKE